MRNLLVIAALLLCTTAAIAGSGVTKTTCTVWDRFGNIVFGTGQLSPSGSSGTCTAKVQAGFRAQFSLADTGWVYYCNGVPASSWVETIRPSGQASLVCSQ